VVPYSESVGIIKNYFAMLFPTFYDGEGFAGTVLDAESAGVPIIASDWKYNSEIVTDDENGYILPAHDVHAWVERLIYIREHTAQWNEKKYKCLTDAKKYEPSVVMQTLISRLA
jgi:glycosyltransferase involved in cell wall biosynthesis